MCLGKKAIRSGLAVHEIRLRDRKIHGANASDEMEEQDELS